MNADVKQFQQRLINMIGILEKELTLEELSSSVTFSLMKNNSKKFARLFHYLNKQLKDRDRMIDLGCGYGFVAFIFKEMLNFKEVYGVDIDDSRLQEANRYVKTVKANLERDPLPFPDNYFDLAISFGVLDHMVFWDTFFSEAFRVLKPGGFLVISLTNLGSWDSRISLLLGFQPRHIEISNKYLAGVNKFYLPQQPVGHIHTCTFRALRELAGHYGFQLRRAFGLRIPHSNRLVRLIDSILHVIPALSVRYIACFQKINTSGYF